MSERSTTTFQQLLKEIDWDIFVAFVKEQQFNSAEELPQYKELIGRLVERDTKKMESTKETLFVGESVEGPSALLRSEQHPHGAAIDFLPWDIVLPCVVETETLQTYSIEEIAFHTLYDMTFDGFDEEERDKNIREMTDRTKDDIAE